MGTRLAFVVVFFARLSLACDAHPGVPHEKWMRWVDGLNAKYAAEQAAAKAAETPVAKKPRVEDRGGRRPVSENVQVRSLRPR